MLCVHCDGGHGSLRPDASQHESHFSSGGDVWLMVAAKLGSRSASPRSLATMYMSASPDTLIAEVCCTVTTLPRTTGTRKNTQD
jgi:hypothetical protein